MEYDLSDCFIPSASEVKDYIVANYPKREWAEQANYAEDRFREIGHLALIGDIKIEEGSEVIFRRSGIMLGFRWACEELDLW